MRSVMTRSPAKNYEEDRSLRNSSQFCNSGENLLETRAFDPVRRLRDARETTGFVAIATEFLEQQRIERLIHGGITRQQPTQFPVRLPDQRPGIIRRHFENQIIG